MVAVRELQKHYDGVVAVDDLSLEIHAGEVFGLLGPNGAGKTTTVECLEGLREPDSGDIEILGLRPGSRDLKERVGVQLQETGLPSNLTVRETLYLFSTFFSRTQPVDYLMKLVGLEEKRNSRSETLSGGQRQRLNLALAVINDPDVIFLDEPTTGLDPQARRGVWDIVRDLSGRGRTILLTTHYMEEAQQLCGRVAILDHGRLVVEGRPSDLLGQHFEESTVQFSAPGSSAVSLEDLPGVISLTNMEGVVSLSTTSVPETVAGLMALASSEGFPLDSFTVRSPTLEDLFIKLTGKVIRD